LRVGVLADDLTGAFDTGVQFSNWGLRVEVLVGSAATSDLSGVDVAVIDTESRNASRLDAYSKVREATERLVTLGAKCFYKKVDSTLRGNIGAEIDATMDATDADFGFLVPAYPTYGRTILAGKLLVNNTPLDKTEYADELCVKTADISAIVKKQSNRKTGLIGYDIVKRGVDSIRAEVSALMKSGMKVAVFDCLTERNLIDISRAIGETKMLVGSAGFASEVPIGLGLRSPRPLLSVCGSTRRLSRVQVAGLRDRLGFREVAVSVGKLIEGEPAMNEEVERCVGEATEAIKAGADVSLTSSPRDSSAEEYLTQARAKGITEEKARLIIEDALGEMTFEVLSRAKVMGLLLTGGATSLKVCQKVCANRISIVEEVEPGIPLLVLGDGLPAITKAGGFGVDNSLIQAAQHLRRLSIE